MWSTAFIRFIRRRVILGLILTVSLLYCILSYVSKVGPLPTVTSRLQHSDFSGRLPGHRRGRTRAAHPTVHLAHSATTQLHQRRRNLSQFRAGQSLDSRRQGLRLSPSRDLAVGLLQRHSANQPAIFVRDVQEQQLLRYLRVLHIVLSAPG
jgi:hypothetical protein